MVKLEKNLPFETKIHNADKPQPKRLTRENRANREGMMGKFSLAF
jgi:hypothetical protein